MRKQIHRLFHKINHDSLYTYYDLFQRSQYYDEEDLKHLQQNYLRELVLHAYHNVPYYKELFNTIGLDLDSADFISQFSKIPLLDKSTIRNNFDKMQAINLPKKRFRKNSTSGSSGESLFFFSDNAARASQALQMRCFDWMGYNHSKKHMLIWGSYFDAQRMKNANFQKIKRWYKNIKVLSAFNIADSNLSIYLDEMAKFNPYLLTSFPSILYRFAYYLDNKGELAYRPKVIQTTGEKLFAFQREAIIKIFRCPIFELYGARDIPMIAMECEKHQGLHIMLENVYLELIDRFGNPTKDGEGEIVITDLHNFVFPFIRYRIGDRAILSKEMCSCGRRLPLIREITGRVFDIIKFPNGNEVGGTFWPSVLKSEKGIRQFQVEQINEFVIEIRFIAEDDFKQEILSKIIDKIVAYSGPALTINFTKVDKIETIGSGGKFCYVKSLKK